MSVDSAQDPSEVLGRLAWVRNDAAGAFQAPPDWQSAAEDLFDALSVALAKLESAGLCLGCGKPVGAYCLECAWPHKRRSERRQNS